MFNKTLQRILFPVLALLILFLYIALSRHSGRNSSSGMAASETIKSSQIPLYVGAENVKRLKRGESVEGVSYRLQLPYDSKEVLDFYDTKMREIGYKPFVEECYKYADRVWQLFTDGTMPRKPEVALLTASWISPDGAKRAFLALRYYWYIDDQRGPKRFLGFNDDLNVVFQFMPFVPLPPPYKENRPER
ncbi:MAG: hypothetical protein ACHQYP_07165 [Nitrospiria bacterium]